MIKEIMLKYYKRKIIEIQFQAEKKSYNISYRK